MYDNDCDGRNSSDYYYDTNPDGTRTIKEGYDGTDVVNDMDLDDENETVGSPVDEYGGPYTGGR